VDLERSLARLGTTRANARDLAGIRDTLGKLPELLEELSKLPQGEALFKIAELPLAQDLQAEITRIIVAEPPATTKNGGMVQDGVDADLDEIRNLATHAKDWLADFQKSERERLKVPSLKVGFNKVFGYYIEITHTHKDRVPEDYIRKQTLVNSERYITEELKEYEEKVLSAEERYTARELEIFNELRERVLLRSAEIQQVAAFLARLDVLACFAQLAFERHYCRPVLNDGLGLEIRGGRHPVIEQTLPVDEAFIPNDLFCDAEGDQILLITGPNMAGKSTYLRQTGLIVLMAQMGAFIPADSASIGIVDRIFTRVGASDNLAGGESTFMVEMNEAANILNNATRRSLILLDEIGRGTSTYDGLAIAWALVEYLHQRYEQAARTLFATHYHELVSLEQLLERVKNYNVAVKEFDDQVVFLRKIIPGGADRSYGIHVAQMAGVPLPVIQRASEILASLDSGQVAVSSDSLAETSTSYDTNQLSLFEKQEQRLRNRLEDIDINHLTPMEALRLVDELLKELGKK
jgi:DNA mismatch repair protein MutS